MHKWIMRGCLAREPPMILLPSNVVRIVSRTTLPPGAVGRQEGPQGLGNACCC